MPKDFKLTKEIDELILENDSIFKIYLDKVKNKSRFPKEHLKANEKVAYEILKKWNKKIIANHSKGKGGWLICENESLADLAIWPFVRQFRLIDTEKFDRNENLIALKSWLDNYINDPMYGFLMKKNK